jgi:hypothetical protein
MAAAAPTKRCLDKLSLEEYVKLQLNMDTKRFCGPSGYEMVRWKDALERWAVTTWPSMNEDDNNVTSTPPTQLIERDDTSFDLNDANDASSNESHEETERSLWFDEDGRQHLHLYDAHWLYDDYVYVKFDFRSIYFVDRMKMAASKEKGERRVWSFSFAPSTSAGDQSTIFTASNVLGELYLLSTNMSETEMQPLIDAFKAGPVDRDALDALEDPLPYAMEFTVLAKLI